MVYNGMEEIPEGYALRICELRQKEVINIRDCQRIGYVMDIDMDPVTGRVCQLIVPGQGKICGLFGRDTEYVIGWKCVRQIGADEEGLGGAPRRPDDRIRKGRARDQRAQGACSRGV